MRRNAELTAPWPRTRRRARRRQEAMAVEIAASAPTSKPRCRELGRISEHDAGSVADRSSGAADTASIRTTRATAASADASANVRDIASAADELAASV